MRKFCTKAALALALLSLLAGCGRTVREEDVAGAYVYEKEGFGGNFTISLQEDGTFTYSAGVLSSHFGVGTWTLEGDVVALQEKTGVNYFRADGETLIFKQKASSNFMYVSVFEGETFSRITDNRTTEK